MKKLVSMVALAAFVLALNVNAQEPKQEKKAKTEKSCCADKKSCDKDKKASCGSEKKAGCCASKKAEDKK
ncbi:hypothetical protein NHF50_03335 [Flavobacterium sp. NRK F10]|uniref:Uncharacterized protein n=1 Tax=Flavobacterium sediminis TaxID=2201181 RepID=A0A2U8QSW8_9FLAO|nr:MULTISPECIES: hypothetical protein [Flavobacterium]AWM12934.1 hypothetical protein DI487_02995 [Flavobacterium sediminis]MCO6174069.1 hypothetical protein [Flavobacterium sp. NRK F10]